MESNVKRNLDRYREFFDRAEASAEYWSAAAAHELIREIETRMARQGVSRAELARRLGSSKAYVTKVLGGNINFTLATMARLAGALNADLQIGLAERRSGRQADPSPRPRSSSPARRPRARE